MPVIHITNVPILVFRSVLNRPVGRTGRATARGLTLLVVLGLTAHGKVRAGRTVGFYKWLCE